MNTKEANKLYWYEGHSLPLKDWAKLKNTKWPILYRRVKCNNWSFKKTMDEPIRE